MNKFKNITRKI